MCPIAMTVKFYYELKKKNQTKTTTNNELHKQKN